MVELLERIKKSFLRVLVGRIDAWEDRVATMPEVHQSVADAPVRFEIMREKLKRKNTGLDPAVAPIMPMTMLGIMRSMQSLKRILNILKRACQRAFWMNWKTTLDHWT